MMLQDRIFSILFIKRSELYHGYYKSFGFVN